MIDVTRKKDKKEERMSFGICQSKKGGKTILDYPWLIRQEQPVQLTSLNY